MDASQAQEAKQLRDENTRLGKLVADLSLDKEALQSVIRKPGGARSAEGRQLSSR
jgi:putative transposase